MRRFRTFIAIDLPKPIRDRIIALQHTLARVGTEVKWVEPENLHVTLLFLGEVDERDVAAVCRTVTERCREESAFAMSVETAGCFPNVRRPRILWVGIGQGLEQICRLHDVLEPPLLALGCYRREERKYTPHVTLGRVKTDRPTEKLAAALAKQAGWKGGELVVNEVLVMASDLTPEGPVYSVLGRARLGGGA
ncbi:MAG: RNA 2',3'-cyclic phosphodiesterase [Gemmataceae bacterium]|nr:RNA 2',3'-cyclic phosphodiesterase [Gemmataceae bacterium]MDW8263724.1 RNA 2',3'-cyclic phosphodiesterase [Gemmataceae bacterium]